MNIRSIRRITCGLILGLVCPLPALAHSPAKDPLRFPAMAYTVQSRQIQFGSIRHTVLYRAYRDIPYVANPVSREFQSLSVDVPVEIDGQAVDASHAPIILNILVTRFRAVSSHESYDRACVQEINRIGKHPQLMSGLSGSDTQAIGFAKCHEVRAQQAYRGELALAAGFVLVTPGVRGSDNRDAQGRYFGKAPAAIVDLKAAVRYIHYNARRLPGNSHWVVAVGSGSAGGLSALLGASGDSPLYAPYLRALGAAEASDKVFAVASYSPMTDLEHADMSYAWAYSRYWPDGADPVLQAGLDDAFERYEDGLGLKGSTGSGPITAATLENYLLKEYLRPSATKFLARLPADRRASYLAANSWIHWAHHAASFSYADFVTHIGPFATPPVFDDPKLRSPANALFGSATRNARHFTGNTLQQVTGRPGVLPDGHLRQRVALMNPMRFLYGPHSTPASHWLLHTGARDTKISPVTLLNLAVRLENLGIDVLAVYFWDGGHCAEEEPAGMIDWLYRLTGYRFHPLNRP